MIKKAVLHETTLMHCKARQGLNNLFSTNQGNDSEVVFVAGATKINFQKFKNLFDLFKPNLTFWQILVGVLLNPYSPNVKFLYPLKTSETEGFKPFQAKSTYFCKLKALHDLHKFSNKLT